METGVIMDGIKSETDRDIEALRASAAYVRAMSPLEESAPRCAACQAAVDSAREAGKAGVALCEACVEVNDWHYRQRCGPCSPHNPGCRCADCREAVKVLEEHRGFRGVRFPALQRTAVPASAWRRYLASSRAYPAGSRKLSETRLVPDYEAPSLVLAAVRLYVVTLAGRHGVTLTPADVAETDLVRWEEVEARETAEEAKRIADERKRIMDERNAEAEKTWNAFVADYPRIAAAERRDMVAAAYEAAIPENFAGLLPMEAGATPEERAALRDALTKPNEHGAIRIRHASDYLAAMAAAVRIANGQERTVLLGGPTGAGKTTLAALMLLRVALEWQKNAQRGAVTEQKPRTAWVPSTDHREDPSVNVGSAIKAAKDAPPHADADPVFRSLVPRLPGERTAWDGMGWGRDDAEDAPLVMWTTAREIFRLQTEPRPFPKNGEEPVDPLAKIRKARVLVIDEIGQEPEQKNVLGVADIVYDRHDAGDVVTIVTTGWTATDGPAPREDDPADVERFLAPMVARYGAAFARRLADPRTCTTLAIGFPRPKDAPRGPRIVEKPAPTSSPSMPRSLSRRSAQRAA